MAYADDLLHDGEFLFLYDYYEPVNPSYPYWDFDPFCLDSFDSCECEAHFRVAKDDLTTLLDGFQIPATFRCPQSVAEWKDFAYCLKDKPTHADISI